MELTNKLPQKFHKIVSAITIFTLFILLFIIGYLINFPSYDWLGSYQPRVIRLINGENPYGPNVFVPPWFLLILTPFAILPDQISNSLIFSITILAFTFMGWRFGMKPFYLLLFLISYPVVNQLIHRQFDWLVILGSFLPPQIGLFLVLSKPQVGIGIAIFWLIDSFKKGGVKNVLKIFSPVIIVFIISYIIYGPFMSSGTKQIGATYNTSIWPFLIPLGLYLLYISIKNNQIKLSIASSICLSPYVAVYSWSAFLLSIAANQWWFAILCVFSWIFKFLA